MSLGKELNERLANFVRLDVHFILKSKELRQEYVELHELIEGYKPQCTGCSAKSKLASWKKKFSKGIKIEVKKSKTKVMSNTFKLKKQHPRLSIPFSGSVITQSSPDDLVWFYLEQAKNEKERKRRESFFETLPDAEIKAEKEAKAKAEAERIAQEKAEAELKADDEKEKIEKEKSKIPEEAQKESDAVDISDVDFEDKGDNNTSNEESEQSDETKEPVKEAPKKKQTRRNTKK